MKKINRFIAVLLAAFVFTLAGCNFETPEETQKLSKDPTKDNALKPFEAPENVKVTRNDENPNMVTISWDEVTGATTYCLYHKAHNSEEWDYTVIHDTSCDYLINLDENISLLDQIYHYFTVSAIRNNK